MREVVIVGAARTPIGSFQGELGAVPATKLGSIAIKAALERAGVPGDVVSEVFMGMVLQAGSGQAPARQAVLGAGLPKSVGATTVHKVCGSGLKAIINAAQAIAVGDAEVVVAGGMESMSNAPYLLPKAREGYRMGHGQLVDSMIHDGLWDVYGNVHMGTCAELCAKEHQFSREAQDAFAAESYKRALTAIKEGRFQKEIVPVEIETRKGVKKVETDEEPGKGDIEKLAGLRTAFDKAGTITAGNASSLNDGAAAVVLCSAEFAAKHNLKVLAKYRGGSSAAQAPEWFTTAPAKAIEALYARTGVKKDDIDLWEINEAFAVVSLANNKLLDLDPAKVNVNGGAVALGHPIGASGARIVVTLLYALEARGKKTGVASLCIGGGEGIAALFERP